MLQLRFDGGTLVLDGPQDERQKAAEVVPDFQHDPRVRRPRAPGADYRRIVRDLTRAAIAFDDAARNYAELDLSHLARRTPYPHQREAVQAWSAGGRCGIVVLPTGSGKTYVAEMAILAVARATLVVAPTLDLMSQWYDRLCVAFGEQVGVMGGGIHDVQDLTVSTYDSAYRHLNRLGNRFGFIVFDEVHHLPAPAYAQAASCAIAPFRLGLTATLERADGREEELAEAVGPVLFRKEIGDLAGEILAPYETVRLSVRLNDEEQERYREARETYLGFLRSKRIRMGGPGGWGRFIRASTRSTAGRRALQAYRRQREIALGCQHKQTVLAHLLRQHRRDRTLIFTDDNDTVYRISRTHLVPAITHETNVRERRDILQAFRQGDVWAVATSRVLNEGVDVPSANVAIILSGSASVREHVQRLGRILRREPGKEALLYEVIAQQTSEENMSKRRRDHVAYRKDTTC